MTDEGPTGGKSTVRPGSDVNSPYYVNPNENLSQGLITVKLDGSNYHLWSRSMRIALKSKKKLGFIDGTLLMPDETDANFEAWDQSNTTVVGWIINSLTSEISELVIDNDSAYDLWKELKEKFGEADSVRIAHLRSAIASCTQGNSTVTEYFNRLKGLWTEYVSFRPIPPCTCGGDGHTGACNTVVAVKKLQENDHVIDFIIGLNADHENTKNQLLLMDPPPDLKVASKFALKMERQIKGSSSKETKQVESVALAAPAGLSRDNRFKGNYGNQNNQTGMDQKKELFCRYCKKDNHMIEDCLRLKWKRKNERNNAGSSGNFAGSAVVKQNDNFTGENAQAEGMTGDNSSNLRLSNEDCTRLMALLQQSSLTASSSNSHQPSSNSVTRQQPSNFAGPSYYEEDWFCKRS